MRTFDTVTGQGRTQQHYMKAFFALSVRNAGVRRAAGMPRQDRTGTAGAGAGNQCREVCVYDIWAGHVRVGGAGWSRIPLCVLLQDDVLYESLTVLETLTYAGLLRLPREMPRSEKVCLGDERCVLVVIACAGCLGLEAPTRLAWARCIFLSEANKHIYVHCVS